MPGTASGSPPPISAGVEQYFLPSVAGPTEGKRFVYRPTLLGTARLHFVSAKNKTDEWSEVTLLGSLPEDPRAFDPWQEAEKLDAEGIELGRSPEEPAEFGELPPAGGQPKSYKKWNKLLVNHLYRNETLPLFRCPDLRLTSSPGESEGDFRARLALAAREKRDEKMEKLRKRFTPKLARVQERVRTATARLEREESQYSQQKTQAAISVGAGILGALFGRKLGSARNVGRATTAARGVGRASREKGDIARAAEKVRIQREKLQDLESEFNEAVEEMGDALDPAAMELDPVHIRPRKADIAVTRMALVWTPWLVDSNGIAEPDYS